MSTNSQIADSVPPESLQAITLSASLTVNDIRKSMAWYRDVLGFKVDQEFERDGALVAVVLRAGATGIVIDQDNGAKGFDRVKGQGFSLQFTTAQNVDELAKRIKAYGGIIESEPADMHWGARIFRIKDPDGFTLVISSERH